MSSWNAVTFVFACLFSCVLCSTATDPFYNPDVRSLAEALSNGMMYRKPRDPAPGDTPIPAQWFDQKLDHFTGAQNLTFKQRYTVLDAFWKPGNPIFIFLDGEAKMTAFEFQEVQIWKWAAQFGAKYISLEHRYYGLSNPFNVTSTQNMTYLTSQQALADAANFIDHYNKTLPKYSEWVVFGCSYSGALSAWFRAKYPNSVVGSLAPSGPVQAEQNYTMYYGQFQTSVNLAYGASCNNAVISAVSQILGNLSTSQGREQMGKTFNTCQPITNQNVYWFKYQLMSTVGSSDQFDNAPAWPLNATCNAMTKSGDYVANWASLMPQGKCLDINITDFVRLTQIEIPNSQRSWWFQKCNEFGFFTPCYKSSGCIFFELDLAPMLDLCAQIFKVPKLQPNIAFTNTFYGGYNLMATNVLFTNGLFDPWHDLSIYANNKWGVQAVTYDAGHCAVVDRSYPTDPPSLITARNEIISFLQSILKQNQSSSVNLF